MNKQLLSSLAIVAMMCSAVVVSAAAVAKKEKRQADGVEDHEAAASDYHHGHHPGGKYFQYTHVPAKDHYDFGHKRGNDHHFIERHEKAHPHAGEFNTKVRWGDKDGGYGEHYWDYNHGGHDNDHHGYAEESQKQEQYVPYEEEPSQAASTDAARYVPAPRRAKREHDITDLNDDVEFINERARTLIVSGATGKHGGNYRKAPELERGKREQQVSLTFDPSTGLIVDDETGTSYKLEPVDEA